MRGGAAVLFVPMLAGCAPGGPKPGHGMVAIGLTDDGAVCGARYGSVTVTDVSSPEAFDRLVAAIPARTAVMLKGVAGVRHACLVTMIDELLQRGIESIGFISEPPVALKPN